MSTIPRVFVARWPLWLGLVVFLIVFRQLYTSSWKNQYFALNSSDGKDAGNVNHVPKMVHE